MNETPRTEIKKLLQESFASKLATKAGSKDTAQFISDVEVPVEHMINTFEESVLFKKIKDELQNNKQHFLTGVTQSLLGSLLLFFVIGVLLFVFQGAKFDFWGSVENFAHDINTQVEVSTEDNP